MEEKEPSILVVIDSDGGVFVSIEYMDKIPATAPDQPVSERFFLGSPQVSSQGFVTKTISDRIFVSLRHLNALLLSAANPLQLDLVSRWTSDGFQKMGLQLLAPDGEEILVDGIRKETGDEQGFELEATGLSEDDEAEDVAGSVIERHDTPQGRAEIEQQEDGSDAAVGDDNGGDGDNNGDNDADDNADDHADDLIVVNPQSARSERAESDIERVSARRSSRALVQQLKDLQLAEGNTLIDLLDNSFVPALDRLERAGGSLVHLATLSTGQVCSIHIFKHLYARRPDLSLAPLDEPGLSNRPMTAYQTFETWRILQVVSKTSYGRQFWPPAEAMWPALRDRHRTCIKDPMDMSLIKQQLFQGRYATMGQFWHDVALLHYNAASLHGPEHDVAAAARRTVDEVRRLAGEACAVGPLDAREPAFHGLVRKVVVSGASGASSYPRYVLPLGSLCVTGKDQAGPTKCIVLMDVTTSRKAIWLFGQNSQACRLVMLAEDIDMWKLGSQGGLMGRAQAPDEVPCRDTLMKEYPESRIDRRPGDILFEKAARYQASGCIRKGWLGRAEAKKRVRRDGPNVGDEDWTPAPKRRGAVAGRTPRSRK